MSQGQVETLEFEIETLLNPDIYDAIIEFYRGGETNRDDNVVRKSIGIEVKQGEKCSRT